MAKNQLKTKISDWLYFAESDLKSARASLNEEIYHIVCFHAQQAVEKIIKARILKSGKNPPRVHKLVGLLDLYPFIKQELKEMMDNIEYLDQFYIPTRYPDAFPGSLPEGLPNKEDAEKALEYAEEIVDFVKKKLNK